MKRRTLELSLKLFNAVPKGPLTEVNHKEILAYGVILDEYAAYATEDVINYFKEHKLSAEQLNATFHKSWKVIRDSSRLELWMHQLLHYMSTYGTNHKSDYIYFPAETLEIPGLTKMPLQFIRGLEKEKLIEKSLKLLSTGIALDEGTIDELLELLAGLEYEFTTVDQIKNKEALVKIIAQTGVYPTHPSEFLRYLFYLSTESTLLIKSKEVITAITAAQKDLSKDIQAFGLKKSAEIFNRFKPIWLAFKSNTANVPLINEISRLSKRYHKPLPVDVLNSITSGAFSNQEIEDALAKANNFRKIRLLHALNTRLQSADSFLYRIRNGKSFSKKKRINGKQKYFRRMFELTYYSLLSSLNLEGQKIIYPDVVDYGIPATEKMFVGNYPTGTKIQAKNLVAGVYWEDEWGAHDLDLSALSLEGKVGWNSEYKLGSLMYSGDITSAPKGATELLYASEGLANPALSMLNIYSGKSGCKFKIVVGQASRVTANYMFDPNELVLEAESEMISRGHILGIFLPEENQELSFVLVNAAFGSMSVSGSSTQSDNARTALFYQYAQPLSLKQLFVDAGAVLVESGENAINLMPQNLQKDSIIKLLS